MVFRPLSNLFRSAEPEPCRIPEGRRVYAIGDIHGRSDLFEQLLRLIAEDERGRCPADTEIILLGDLIDRGPDSKGVVERAMALARARPARCLMGNHEEVFLRALEGDARALRFLGRIGGRETLLSYGIGDRDYRELDHDALMAVLRRQVPAEHVEFLSGFESWIEVGDYLFVHAGIRPHVALEEQAQSDLCWIREEFLNHRESFGKVVVHGHSITDRVDLRSNRIGIDTGAYASDRLTAIGVEGEERWFLST
ncbi:MAG TPA: metallophosphoesterase family protein [Allosphingosinicella sp.]|nr:metallophosphoesterase family protein [Allosphingosinicella sp.]